MNESQTLDIHQTCEWRKNTLNHAFEHGGRSRRPQKLVATRLEHNGASGEYDLAIILLGVYTGSPCHFSVNSPNDELRRMNGCRASDIGWMHVCAVRESCLLVAKPTRAQHYCTLARSNKLYQVEQFGRHPAHHWSP